MLHTFSRPGFQRTMIALAGAAGLALVATSAQAEPELRDFCADRPGLNTPPCTVDPGHVVVEVGLGDWTLDRQPDARTDTIIAGDLLVRYGLDATTEIQLGWTSYGHVRVRDNATGAISKVARTGDVLLSVRKSLAGPDGKVAIQPFVTVPVGHTPVGAGDWGAGVLLPIGFDLVKGIQIAFTPEVDAAVDSDGSGRHLAYGSVAGLTEALTKKINLTEEISATRDEDPSGHTTQALASLSLAYQPGKNSQFDVGTVLGLNRNSPDVEVYFGVARRF
ncbi:transporter [Sphingomonas sp.]|uniref:transporter n=1 Tax=Sphingomonas sp. TaxID=28214 RepID=UPI0025D1BA5F|nr:transporter [Sphingomonas sp.]